MSSKILCQPWFGRFTRVAMLATLKIALVTLAALLGSVLVGIAHSSTPPAGAGAGSIAYVRADTGDEIRLIEPDGSNDRRLWAHGLADPQNVFDILSLDWRPDGSELAFSSNHERTCSIFGSDIYSIQIAASSFRRVTNGPDCASLSGYPKGSVTVTVRNDTSKFDTNFYVYVQGAPGIIGVTIPWNGVATVTFPDVADFGAVNQWVALLHTGDSTDLHSDYRWYVGEVDVQPAQMVTATPNPAPAFGDGAPYFGAWGPTWRNDGSRIGYARSAAACLNAYSVPANNAPLGVTGEPIIMADDISPCSLAWGPTAATANQVIFLAYPNLGMDGATFYRAAEGAAASSATELFSLGSTVLLLWYDWLPDGEGFLFVRTTEFANTSFVEANLFEYNFATGSITQLTYLNDEFVRSFGVSPDGQSIVFERAPSLDSLESDLWLMNRDGSDLRLLVTNGSAPAWGFADTEEPTPLAHHVHLPFVLRD